MTEKELAFIEYWEKNRLKEKNNPKPIIIGLTLGLSISLILLLFIFSGWYQRATMIANAKFSPTLFIFIALFICVFIAYLYRIYKWEQYEQQYQELKSKQNK